MLQPAGDRAGQHDPERRDPDDRPELHATDSQLQWIVDSYTLVFAGLLLTAGALGDNSVDGALQIGLAIFGLGSVLSAMPTREPAHRDPGADGGRRRADHAGHAVDHHQRFPAEERGRAIGVWAGVAGLGAALGPLTGGFLVEHFYWGSVFLVNVPIVVVGLVAGVVLIPTSKDPQRPGSIRRRASCRSSVSPRCSTPSSRRPPRAGGDQHHRGFVAGAVLLVAFVLWELHTDHPMLDVHFFQNPASPRPAAPSR